MRLVSTHVTVTRKAFTLFGNILFEESQSYKFCDCHMKYEWYGNLFVHIPVTNIMDGADHDIFSLTPPPYLLGIFTVFKAIWKTVPSVQMSQEQLHTLASYIAELLQTLDLQYCAGKLQENNTADILDDLDKSVIFKSATRRVL